jgi:phage/plasmid-like protein (TIGR03299 family)
MTKMKAVQYDLKDAKTAIEALELSQSNWEAQPVGLVTENGINVPNHKAIIRTDNNTVLGVVGSRYTLLQNSLQFSFFDIVCEQNAAVYDKAFVLDNGRKIILEASMPIPMTIRPGDEVVKKIRLINTFDGSYPFLAQFVAWRKVCSNGLMGWKNENKAIVYHTKNGESKAQEALRVLAASQHFFDRFEIKCKELAQKIMDKKMVDSFIKQVVGESTSTRATNIIEKVNELYEAGKGTGQGTAWDLYNGYIEYVDHFRSADDETRLANAVLGANPQKEKAFEVITAIAKN